MLTFISDADQAEPLLRECVELRRSILGEENYLTQYARGALGECLLELERFEQGEPLVVNAYWAIRAVQGPGSVNTQVALRRVIRLYDVWHAAEPEEDHDAEAAEWRARLEQWEGSTEPAENGRR